MSTISSTFTQPRVKRWSKREYFEQVERGMFARQRIHLFRGDIIEMPPQGYQHHYVVTELTAWLQSCLDADAHRLRVQLPFETPGNSVPEPDMAIVATQAGRRFPAPDQALLIIEVSDSSLQYDVEKAFEYAGADVPEYWIVDCQSRSLIRYSEIVEDLKAVHGKSYSQVKTFAENETISPIALPAAKLEIRKIFP